MRPIAAASSDTPPPPTAVSQRTAWHSPVPYLFGGLAAMLGLIAFALLILACSYWKLSVQSEERERQERDLESENAQNHEKNNNSGKGDETKVYEEKILVIMAGDQKPTFLATPVTAKVSSFRDCNVSGFKLQNAHKETDEICGKVKEMSHHENDEEDQA